MLYLDIETFSCTDLRTADVYRYADDASFQILVAAWATDDGPIHTAVGTLAIVDALGERLLSDEPRCAHNAQFERICFSAVLGQTLPPDPWVDTMALAAEWGLPRSLGALAVALGAEPKDEAGTRLINLFSKPQRGVQLTERDRPTDWRAFIDYCTQDVATLRDIHRQLHTWPTDTEHQMWLLDQRINDRGMAIDTDLARAASRIGKQNQRAAGKALMDLTGITTPKSIPQLTDWFNQTGLQLPNLRAATVAEALAGELTPEHREALELRQELSLSAAAKFDTALRTEVAGRVHGTLQFYGAHTGRWAGRGMQPQNLPRETIARTEAAIEAVKRGEPTPATTLKALIRPTFTGPLTVCDFASIEARVIAWLSGEEWVLEAARAGRDLYVETANRIGEGVTRQQGKVAVLALGYNGAVGSLRAMGAEGSDAELTTLVKQWRAANQHIVRFWYDLERAFWLGGPAGNRIRVKRKRNTRYVFLPSGRPMVYRDVRKTRDGRLLFTTARGPTADTYGGRLAENVTQAVARDLLVEAMLTIDSAGYRICGHVHDEVLVEGEHAAAIEQLMTRVPDWADGLPLAGQAYTCARYRKD